ncbi:MAG: hypothetical protein J6S63_01230 [Atopobiaceae bacterium]|nr:hypothetical protein [Atopobiaceae bacterium]
MPPLVLDDTFKITITDGVDTVTFSPQEYSLVISGVDYDTGRVASGMMERNQVGEKRSCQIQLPPMHTAELQPIMKIVSGVVHTSFTATIVDPTQPSGYYTGTFYVGDRTLPAYNFHLDLWNGATFDIIEF